MPNLNLDLNYFTHRKTKRLVGLLGRGAEVLPIRLWCYCGMHHCETGALADYSPQEIESMAEWWGTPGQMLQAMLTVGFMEKTSDGYRMKSWLEHQGHIAAFKAKGKAMAEARWRPDKSKVDAVSNAGSITASNARANGASEDVDAREDGLDVEPPKHWPKSEGEALQRCGHVGPETAGKAWLQARARGWRDSKDVPIRCSFQSWIQLAHKYEIERQAKEKKNGNHPKSSRPGADRNADTANAGKSAQYRDVGKVGKV